MIKKKLYPTSVNHPDLLPRPNMTMQEVADFMRSNPDELKFHRSVKSGARQYKIIEVCSDNFQQLHKQYRLKEKSWEEFVENEIAVCERRFREGSVDPEKLVSLR